MGKWVLSRKKCQIFKGVVATLFTLSIGQAVFADGGIGEKKIKLTLEGVADFSDGKAGDQESFREKESSQRKTTEKTASKKRRRSRSQAATLESAAKETSEEDQQRLEQLVKLETLASQVQSILEAPDLSRQKVHWGLVWPILESYSFPLDAFMRAASVHKRMQSLEDFSKLLRDLGEVQQGVDGSKVPAAAVFILAIFSQRAYFAQQRVPDPNKRFYNKLFHAMNSHTLDILDYQEEMKTFSPYPVDAELTAQKMLGDFWRTHRKHFNRGLMPQNHAASLVETFEAFKNLPEESSAWDSLKHKTNYIDLIDAAKSAWPEKLIPNGDVQLIKFVLDYEVMQSNALECDEDEDDDCITITEGSEKSEITVIRMVSEHGLYNELGNLLAKYGSANQKQSAWVYWGLNCFEVEDSTGKCSQGGCPEKTGQAFSDMEAGEGHLANIESHRIGASHTHEESVDEDGHGILDYLPTIWSSADSNGQGGQRHYVNSQDDKRVLEVILGEVDIAYETSRFLSYLDVDTGTINQLTRGTRTGSASIFQVVKLIREQMIPLEKILRVLKEQHQDRMAAKLESCLKNNARLGECGEYK